MQVKADIGITILATDLQQKINQLMKKDHEIIELKKQIQQLKNCKYGTIQENSF